MKCVVCGAEIIGAYWIDKWQQPMCQDHKIEYCYSCERFVKPSDFHSPDGRCLCSLCIGSVVSKQPHIDWVKERVYSIFRSHEIHGIPYEIPIKLVTPAEMAEIKGAAEVNLFQQGLTMTTNSYSLFSSHLSHTVYMLTLMPKVLFAGVLAHELLHVWQNEKGIHLIDKYSEGLCNLGSYFVYSAINNDLSKGLIKNMEEDPDPIYGEGFRNVLGIYRKVGTFKDTIEFITTLKT